MVQDPVVHYDYSPYNAFDNNPVYWADPSGADSETDEMGNAKRDRWGMYIPMNERGSQENSFSLGYDGKEDFLNKNNLYTLGGKDNNDDDTGIDPPRKKAPWDTNGDGKLQKSEADNWGFYGNGVTINVDNSLIDWSGLEMILSTPIGDTFDIQTHDAFRKLPWETSSTYGGTQFRRTGNNTADVQDQKYHYNSRPITLKSLGTEQGWRDVARNILNEIGKPSGITYSSTGLPNRKMTFIAYDIHYLNPSIKFNN